MSINTFIGYRPAPPSEYYDKGTANPPDQPQYEGVQFSDGTVVIRWVTQFRSHSIWPDFETFRQVHGHPEYGTYFVWDGPDDAPDGIVVRSESPK